MGHMKTTMDICLYGPSALEMWRDIDLIDDPAIDVRTAEVHFNRNPLHAPLWNGRHPQSARPHTERIGFTYGDSHNRTDVLAGSPGRVWATQATA